jgi:hypothetical protein
MCWPFQQQELRFPLFFCWYSELIELCLLTWIGATTTKVVSSFEDRQRQKKSSTKMAELFFLESFFI